MAHTTLTVEQTLALLAATPERFAALTTGLTPAQLRTRPSQDEWSANEVLAHVRACADVRGGPILRIIAEEHPTLRAVNPLTWIERTDYLDLEFEVSLRAFAAQRAGLLAALRPLGPEDWARAATVTGAGKPLIRTALGYAQWVAHHERPHVRQMEQIAKALRE